jgi:hypothetical protein
MTLNKKDFPHSLLAEEGVERLDPDGYLHGLWLDDATAVEAVARRVLTQAQELSGQDWDIRSLLKKARLPRLAKALGTA